MKNVIYILRYSLLLVVATLVCSCEQDRLSDTPNVREGEAVEVTLDMKASEMMQVQTRAAADDEIARDGIYALVFDASNKLVEVAKVNAAAGGYTVKLAYSSSGRKVVVVANAAQAIKKVLPKLATKDWTYDELRAEILAPELPHTGTPGNADCRITAMPTQHPMTGSVELAAGINSATVINSTGVAGGDPLLLSRNTVKITVAINTATGADPSLADLTLQGANLAFAPLTARVLPAPTAEVLPVFPTGHYVGTGGALSDMMVGAVAGGKSSEPLYCYASSKMNDTNENGTYVIIEATYNGEKCYYRLDLRDERIQLELKGNVHYTIKINKAQKKGYPNVEEAMSNRASNNLSSEIIVTDPSANEVVNDDYSYLAISNSACKIMGLDAIDDLTLTTVTHNAYGVTGAIAVVGEGLTLANGASLDPAPKNGITKKDIKVHVTAAFTSGTVNITLGSLTQSITITRPPCHLLKNWDKIDLGTGYTYIPEGVNCPAMHISTEATWNNTTSSISGKIPAETHLYAYRSETMDYNAEFYVTYKKTGSPHESNMKIISQDHILHIEHMIVAKNDLPNPINYHEANGTLDSQSEDVMGTENTGCNTLGSGWRVPAIGELQLIWKNRDGLVAKGAQAFKHDSYWSLTHINSVSIGPYVPGKAITLNFGKNDVTYNYTSEDVTSVRYVRCVKDYLPFRFEIAKSDLIKPSSGYFWNVAMGLDAFANEKWSGSAMGKLKTGCNTLEGDGWRVPTVEEMWLMASHPDELVALGVDPILINKCYYWTSLEELTSSSGAFTISRYSWYVKSHVIPKTNKGFQTVRCVRDK